MLRCTGIQPDGHARCLFRIQQEGHPATEEDLGRVARLGEVLLRENSLEGGFQAAGEGLLALELEEDKRTFFHNGIVFAALDAFNDPVKNPTLTLSAEPDTE